MPDSNSYSIKKSDLSDDALFRLNSALVSISDRIAALESANTGLYSGTVTLAPVTVGGKSGTLTLASGKATAYTAPT